MAKDIFDEAIAGGLQGQWERGLGQPIFHYWLDDSDASVCGHLQQRQEQPWIVRVPADFLLFEPELRLCCSNCEQALKRLLRQRRAANLAEAEQQALQAINERLDKGQCCPVMAACHKRAVKARKEHLLVFTMPEEQSFCAQCPYMMHEDCPEMCGERESVCVAFYSATKQLSIRSLACGHCPCTNPVGADWQAAFANWQRELGIRERLAANHRKQLYTETMWTPGDPQML